MARLFHAIEQHHVPVLLGENLRAQTADSVEQHRVGGEILIALSFTTRDRPKNMVLKRHKERQTAD